MRARRHLILLGALLALGCSDSTSPGLLDGTWRQDITIAGNSVEFTLTTSGDAVSGTGQWTGEACCGGPVNVTGDVTGGDVNLSLSFVANGNVVPPFTARFAGRLIDSNTLSGVVVGANGDSASASYRRVR
jgi:hypothetical protein